MAIHKNAHTTIRNARWSWSISIDYFLCGRGWAQFARWNWSILTDYFLCGWGCELFLSALDCLWLLILVDLNYYSYYEDVAECSSRRHLFSSIRYIWIGCFCSSCAFARRASAQRVWCLSWRAPLSEVGSGSNLLPGAALAMVCVLM